MFISKRQLLSYLFSATKEFMLWNSSEYNKESINDWLKKSQEALQNIVRKIQDANKDGKVRTIKVVFLSDFSAGKSSMINALLQKEICPKDINPTTQICTIFKYGHKLSITKIINEKREKVNLYQYQSDVQKIHKEQLQFEIFYPCNLLRQIDIIDTIGLNAPNGNDSLTWNKLSMADIICYLLPSKYGTPQEDNLSDLKKAIEQKNTNTKFWLILSKVDQLDTLEDLQYIVPQVQENLQKNCKCDKILTYCVKQDDMTEDEWKCHYMKMHDDFCKEITNYTRSRINYYHERFLKVQPYIIKDLKKWKNQTIKKIEEELDNIKERILEEKKEALKAKYKKIKNDNLENLQDCLTKVPNIKIISSGLFSWKRYTLSHAGLSFKSLDNYLFNTRFQRFGLNSNNFKSFKDFINKDCQKKLHEDIDTINKKKLKDYQAKEYAENLRNDIIDDIIKEWNNLYSKHIKTIINGKKEKLDADYNNTEQKINDLINKIKGEKLWHN